MLVVAVNVPPPAVDSAAGGAGALRGRVVVVGSAEVANDRFLGSASNNMAFILNSVDWLAQDEDLIAIRAKNRAPPPIAYSSSVKRSLARYGNLIGIPALIIGVGVLRLWRRRQRTSRPYVPESLAAGPA